MTRERIEWLRQRAYQEKTYSGLRGYRLSLMSDLTKIGEDLLASMVAIASDDELETFIDGIPVDN